jgi:hypothetical protein
MRWVLLPEKSAAMIYWAKFSPAFALGSDGQSNKTQLITACTQVDDYYPTAFPNLAVNNPVPE